MYYSPSRFKKEFPEEKRKKDNYTCRFFVRPISFVIASIFTVFKISANATSIIGFLLGLASCILVVINYFVGTKVLVLVSIILFIIWLFLDCVDGNIARTVKSGKYGDFFDAISGYIYPGLYFALFGFYASKTYDVIFKSSLAWLGLLSSVASLSFVLLVLNNKKFEENSIKYSSDRSNDHTSSKIAFLMSAAKRISSEINFGGLMPFILLFAFIFDFCAFATIVYAVFFILLSVAGNFVLIAKALKA